METLPVDRRVATGDPAGSVPPWKICRGITTPTRFSSSTSYIAMPHVFAPMSLWPTHSGNNRPLRRINTLDFKALVFMTKVLVFLAILAVTAFPAGAALGGSAESVVVDQSKFRAKRSVVER